MGERVTKWMPQPEIDFSCADISYEWRSRKDATLVVVMHFSRVLDGFAQDLQLTFSRVLAVQWEEESSGLIHSQSSLPTCTFRGWTHPTLIVEGSEWASRYAANRHAADDARVTHYLLVSLNDLLHVLAEVEPRTRWVTPIDA